MVLLGCLIWCCGWPSVATAGETETDSTRLLRLGRIIISGNKVTLRRIIERELTLQAGDTIRRSGIDDMLKGDERRLYNLRLFNRIELTPLFLDESSFDLLVEVVERWYTYPAPIFELSDRNFNEWWQNYRHDFSRVNYGLRLFQYNFRGRNETLRLTARLGFSERLDLYYKIPNLTRNQKHGLLFEFIWAKPKNLAYRTEDHILTFLKDREVLRDHLDANVTYTFRPSFYQTHSFSIGHKATGIADTVLRLNPDYLGGRHNQRYSSIGYTFIAEHRDVIAYPLRGYQVTASIQRSGIGGVDDVGFTNLWGSFAGHTPWSENLFFSWYSALSVSLPSGQPYNLYQGVGYRRQYLRGYEVYVIEGPFFNLNKVTLKTRLLNREWNSGLPWEQFRTLPLAVYLKLFADGGVIENYPSYESSGLNTRLTGRPLAGYGLGLDVVGYYDSVIRFEYTFTNQGNRGFFLHIRKEF